MALSQIWPKSSLPVSSFFLAFRGLSTSLCLFKNRKSGVPKGTPFRTLPLTYDEAQPPSKMNVTKGCLSWNTTNLYEEKRHAETTFEDLVIRKFMFGTWHGVLASEVVIKRRHNLIVLSFLASMEFVVGRQVYFLQGYTEELLTNWLKCPVKVELSAVASKQEVVFKKI